LREVVRSKAFRKDVKRADKRGKDMAKLRAVILQLIEDAPLDPRYRDLHLEPD
jgi:mRNA interferase YafQ